MPNVQSSLGDKVGRLLERLLRLLERLSKWDGESFIDLKRLIEQIRSPLKSAAPEALAQVDRSNDEAIAAWKEMKDTCTWAVKKLREHKQTVKDNKTMDDKKSAGLSVLGTGAGMVGVLSLVTPVTWPVAAASFAASATSGLGGIVQNQQRVQWESNVKSAIETIQSNFQDKADKLKEKMQAVIEIHLVLIRDLLKDQNIAVDVKVYAETYQVSQGYTRIVNQLIKIGPGAWPVTTASTGMAILPDSAGECCTKFTKKLSKIVLHTEARVAMKGGGVVSRRAVSGGQRAMASGAKVVRKSQTVAARQAEKECVKKAVKNASSASTALKVAGGALAAYSFGSELYNLTSTLIGMDQPHELCGLIDKILDAIRKEKNRAKVVLREYESQ